MFLLILYKFIKFLLFFKKSHLKFYWGKTVEAANEKGGEIYEVRSERRRDTKNSVEFVDFNGLIYDLLLHAKHRDIACDLK